MKIGTAVVLMVICLIVGMVIGCILYGIVAAKRIDEYKYEQEAKVQEIISNFSDRIFGLQDIIELIKLKVKDGTICGHDANYRLKTLNQIIDDAEKEWNENHNISEVRKDEEVEELG